MRGLHTKGAIEFRFGGGPGDYGWTIGNSDRAVVAECWPPGGGEADLAEILANGRRIVAAWGAVADVPTEDLWPGLVDRLRAALAAAERERDMLRRSRALWVELATSLSTRLGEGLPTVEEPIIKAADAGWESAGDEGEAAGRALYERIRWGNLPWDQLKPWSRERYCAMAAEAAKIEGEAAGGRDDA